MSSGVSTRTGPSTLSEPEVEALYAAASAVPPLFEPPEVAAAFAELYGSLRGRPDLVVASSRDRDGLTGFAYGHPWRWSEQDDPWSDELRLRLGPAAPVLDGRLAVYLLAVHPRATRRGLGRALLRGVLAAGAPHGGGAWLQTRDDETPAMALYRSEGWTPLGHGPRAPGGRPGLVLVWGPS